MHNPNLYSLGIIMMLAFACHSPRSIQTKTVNQKQNHQTQEQNTALWNYIGNYKWQLIQIEGTLHTKSPIHLTFDITKLRFNGNAGCNAIAGSYYVEDDHLFFDKVASTEMACQNDSITALEHHFIVLLNKSPLRFDVADQTLNLYKRNKLVLMFAKRNKVEK